MAIRDTPYPPLWHKELLKKKARWEKERLKTLERVEAVLEQLEKMYHWKDAYIFGSITGKTAFRSSSDVDVALAGLNKLDLYSFVGDISMLMNRPVDVVRLEECGFAESIVKRGVKWTKKNS